MGNPLSVCAKLKSLNPAKGVGPNGICYWVLKEYAEILTSPISELLNTSYIEQKLPSIWKRANVEACIY